MKIAYCEASLIDSNSFSIIKLLDKLRLFQQELIQGRGFGLISGLAIEQLHKEEMAVIFMEASAYIGNARSQNAASHLLGHVRDVDKDSAAPNVRIYQTSNRQTFHTDSADVVGLMCLKSSKSDGDSLLVSGETITKCRSYTQVWRLICLSSSLLISEVKLKQEAIIFLPHRFFHGIMSKLTTIYQRQYIDSAQRLNDTPRLSTQHGEALYLFGQIANDRANHFCMRLQAGDMQFVHNHNLLHDRTGFEDWPDQENKDICSVYGQVSLMHESCQRCLPSALDRPRWEIEAG